MKEFLLVATVCALMLGFVHGLDDELAKTEVGDEYIEYMELEDMEPTTCPGVRGCLKNCPMGHYRDDETGCLTCHCASVGMFEADILVSDKDFWRLMERYDATAPMTPPGSRKKRGAYSLKEAEWPKKGADVVIPYIFDSTISGYKKKRIIEAITEYRSRTCVRFVKRTTEADYIEFYGLGGCSSHVGRIGGKQKVSIGRNCERRLGTVIHEIMHALGFWHEQSRGDRDEHVTVKWDNIRKGFDGNFEKMERFWNNLGSPYDINSVMHYGGNYFAKKPGLATMLDKATGKMILAQRDYFSTEDIRQINAKYKCSAYLTADSPVSYEMPACVDELSTLTCQKYFGKGYCKYSNFKTKCQSTCKACPSSKGPSTAPAKPVCKDNSRTCKKLVAKNFCSTSKSTMMKFCKSSCGFCGDAASKPAATCVDVSKKCVRWGKVGYCTKASHKTYMKRACKKTCGICLADQPLPEELFDKVIRDEE